MTCGPCGGTRMLTRKVTVQKIKSGLTQNASGHIDETNDSNWTIAGTEWVELVTRGSREFFRGQEIAADITHQITMRWSKKAESYTTDMRIKYGTRTLHIAEPPKNVDEKNEWLVFATKEIK